LINNTPGPSNYYLIYDGRQYSATYSPFAVAFVGLPVPVYNPQHTEVDTKQMVVQVAAFRAATLDMDMHSASLPIDFNFEVTPRVQARLSVGPTFNLFNEDLKTDTYYQLLDAGVMRITKNNSERVINGAPPISLTGTGGGTVVGTIPGTRGGNVSSAGGNSSTVSSMTSFQAASSAGGGKGSSGGQSRSLPGQSLARVSNHDNSQHFECGVFGQFAVDVDLDAAKRWFLEAYARYDYVPTFSVSDGAASSLIDASSWGAGIGLGLRF
jgi:hypothetical protein